MTATAVPPDGIDVVIRCHDPARLDELERAVLSALLQDYAPVSVIVVCQCFDEQAVEAVRAALEPIHALEPSAGLVVLNRSDPAPADARAALLNVGIGAARHRYLAFLDYDDLIYPEAYRLLIADLNASGAAIAFGGILNAVIDRRGSVPYVAEKIRIFKGDGLPQLLRSNFCPLHSFVLDRSLVAKGDLKFDETLAQLEDYNFLLCIVSRYRSSFVLKDKIIGEYCIKNDGSNINPIASGETVPPEWQAAMDVVEARKAGLVLAPEVQAILDVDHPGLSVAHYLTRNVP